MRRNLDLTGGLIVAEAVMMALAEHTGRQDAHDIVYAACRAALDKGSTLLDELAHLPEVTRHLDKKRLAELTDPVNYLGSAQPWSTARCHPARRAPGGVSPPSEAEIIHIGVDARGLTPSLDQFSPFFTAADRHRSNSNSRIGVWLARLRHMPIRIDCRPWR